MTEVLLGVGSNINREENLRAGLQALCDAFGEVICSPVFESEAIGFAGSPFFNLVVRIETTLTVGELQRQLRGIEFACGRLPDQRKYSPRTLDIDILTYGDCVGEIDGVILPREEILENAFVLWPLACLVPEAVHPVTKESYFSLWAAYDKSRQRLALAVVPGLPGTQKNPIESVIAHR